MLTFFRRIRKGLLGEGATSKYLVYAIGEILLVMVGILLALQVNNWNEKRISQKIESEHLSALYDEFVSNIEEIKSTATINQKNLDGIREMIKYLGPNEYQLSENGFNRLLDSISSHLVSFDPSLGVLQDLISSGNLNRISNNRLRRKIANWESLFIKIKLREERVQFLRTQQFEMMINDIGFLNMLKTIEIPLVNELDRGNDNFEIDNRKLLRDSKFENILTFRYTTSKMLGMEYRAFQDYTNSIINLIEEELEKS